MALLGNACIPSERVPSEIFSSEGRKFLIARPVNRVHRILCAMFIGLLSVAMPSARGQVAQEYDLKAAIMKYFAAFVDWPTNAFPDPKSPITIGVLGKDPFGKSLDIIVEGVIIRGRKLVVQRYKVVEEIKICHILFISQSEMGKLSKIFADLKGRHILTVGDNKSFARTGGIIEFEIVDGKPRLIINEDNAASEQLTIDSRLLKEAVLIKEK